MLSVLKGILTGLFLMLFIGPSFFFLIRVSVQKGFRNGAAFALGIILSDAAFLFAIFFGFSQLFENELFKTIFSLVGGLVIVGIGLMSLIQKHEISKISDENPTKKMGSNEFLNIIKGFSINIINPFTFIMWVGIIAAASAKESFTEDESIAFFLAILITVFSADMAKAYFANRLGKILTQRNFTIINKVLGGVFIFFGLRLIFHFVELMHWI